MREFWVDLETTGLNNTDKITEFAGVYIEDDTIEELHFFIKHDEYPSEYNKVSEITGLTPDFLKKNGITEDEFYEKLLSFLNDKVDRFDKTDKMVISGYNVRFDVEFLRFLFSSKGNKYFGSYFFPCVYDVYSTVGKLVSMNKIKPENFKLKTLCELFKIDIKAHSALSDIKSTIELDKKLIVIMKGENKWG